MPDFAIVITSPALRDDLVHAVRAASRHTSTEAEITVLAAGQAAELRFAACEGDAQAALAAARQVIRDGPVGALRQAPADVNLVVCDANRRKRLLIADMDSTIIGQECIDEIADLAGYGPQVAAITERAMRGELDFEAALTTRVGLLKGLHVSALDRVITERLTVTPGAKELVATMKANGARTALVSGGFTFFTSRIAQMVGFDENRANTLEIADDRLTGRPVSPILGRQAKLDALNEIIAAHHIPAAATLAVGDGANDLAMIEAAGLGVAYHAKPVVAEQAAARIDHGDLTTLLYLQGYHSSEIIR